MKRFLVTLFAILFSVAIYAQEHLSFKGISMGCDLTTFVSKLKGQGFTQELLYDDAAILKGDFAGKSNCTVVVAATKATKAVWKVLVIFPEKSSWYSLKSEYLTFKESYTSKYGKPSSYEYFRDPYDEGDGYEMQAVRLEKCTYRSFFKLSMGDVCLEISDDECVQVHYQDKINSAILDKEEQQSVSNDI